MCKRRLNLLLKRLKSNPELLEKYNDIINGQKLDGIVESVDDKYHEIGNVHYIPHREVIREQKTTTKIRIVYDASAKMKNRPSLNDCLEKGPCMLPKIFDIIVRFRCFKYVVTSDIQSAFLNIRVNERDRDFLRFLWIDDIHKDDPEIVIMRFTSVMFGITSSPFLLGATILVHMKKYADMYPDVVEKFLRDLFMDDSVTGAQFLSEAYQLYSISKKLMSEGGFMLRKWTTNNGELRERINTSEKEIYNESDEFNTDTENKVLGVNWDANTDTLYFSVEMVIKEALKYEGVLSKRYVLKVIASIFDPLGVLSPVIAGFKMILQDVCQLKSGWDDEISGELQIEWKKLLHAASGVGRIHVPRNYLEDGNLSDVRTMELHGFCAASGKAYAAVVYLRVVFCDGVTISKFIASKSRVAP